MPATPLIVNFHEWLEDFRRRTPLLANLTGSCMLPKKTIVEHLQDAYEAGFATARAAAAVPSPN